MKAKRLMLKLSGEFLSGTSEIFSEETLKSIVLQIKQLVDEGFQVAMVVGGGNIWRHRDALEFPLPRIQSDSVGMLATIVNASVVAGYLESVGQKALVAAPFAVPNLSLKYKIDKSRQSLNQGTVVICAGGTGHPFFTTDSAAALRACELECDLVLKATNVDGVYSADPRKDTNAILYKTCSFADVLEKQLQVMDQTAFCLCMENRIPIRIFNATIQSGLHLAANHQIGTLIS